MKNKDFNTQKKFVSPCGSVKCLKVGSERTVWVITWTGLKVQPMSFVGQALRKRTLTESLFLDLRRRQQRVTEGKKEKKNY